MRTPKIEQLYLDELLIELLGGAAVLHALQAGDLKAQLLQLKLLGNQQRFGDLERGTALEHQALERFNVVRQISCFGHGPHHTARSRGMHHQTHNNIVLHSYPRIVRALHSAPVDPLK
jgi:hypothetical protein